MGKKVIRLTESDLTRLIKRIIKESDWSSEDDDELRSTEDEYKKHYDSALEKSRAIHSKYRNPNTGKIDWNDEAFSEIDTIMNEPGYKSSFEKLQGLRRKRSDYDRMEREKFDKERYSKALSNRPQGFDTRKANHEIQILKIQMDDLKNRIMKISDVTERINSPEVEKWTKLNKRKNDLMNLLDKDFSEY